jgi:outer membrane protein assembly factor BamB
MSCGAYSLAERRPSSHRRAAVCTAKRPLRSNEASPIVIGNTLYVSTSWGPKYVYALDAATGARKWTYEPDIPDDVLQYACCDVNNRGIAYADGKLFVGRLDGKLKPNIGLPHLVPLLIDRLVWRQFA